VQVQQLKKFKEHFNFMHDFMDNYGAHTIEKLKASGASPAAVQVQVQQLKKFKEPSLTPPILNF
jgi:hypothetical protein